MRWRLIKRNSSRNPEHVFGAVSVRAGRGRLRTLKGNGSVKKIVYYNVEAGIEYEKQLLKEWKIEDAELVEVSDPQEKMSFAKAVGDADGVVMYYYTVGESDLSEMPNLKVIALQSIGFNNVDIAAATRNGVCITNIPGYCSNEVALHTVAMLLDLERQITFLDREVRKGGWNPMCGYSIYRLKGQTFGMVFFGSIAKEIVPMVKAFGMKVLVYAPTKSREYLESFGVEKAETLEELCRKSDVVSMHCPLNDATRGMMGKEQFTWMKPGAFFINTARGGVVEEDALADALQERKIRAAAVDVVNDEAEGKSRLRDLDNVVMTPHSAFLSEDAFLECRRMSLEQAVQRVCRNEKPSHTVNPDVTV